MASCGFVGASKIAAVMAKGQGKTRWSYMANLIAARLSGVQPETYSSWEMKRGIEVEADGIALYEWERGITVEPIGFVPHPTIMWAGATPDGAVDTDGLIEMKSPNTSTHIDTLLGQKIGRTYELQMQFQMACTARSWVDWCSFDPRMPEEMQLYIKRVERNEEWIREIENEVRAFLAEMDAKIEALEERYGESGILLGKLRQSVG